MNVLFLCTGNYYRSRFAEMLFGHLARQAGLECRVTSRALAVERGVDNIGPISKQAIAALGQRGVSVPDHHRLPQQAADADFCDADLVVAMKEAEHRPLMQERFPAWAGRVRYWHVHDTDAATPQQAFAEIEANVKGLIASLCSPLETCPRKA